MCEIVGNRVILEAYQQTTSKELTVIKMSTSYIKKTTQAAYSSASNADTLKKVLPLLVADDTLSSEQTMKEMDKFYMAVQAAK
jgi:hypothetical protein